uniref:Uncharacterized protein n=1 Tax=Rhizophora mucronata TaxID=61149 RepID=A0A2P2R1P9_RHIMU
MKQVMPSSNSLFPISTQSLPLSASRKS